MRACDETWDEFFIFWERRGDNQTTPMEALMLLVEPF